MIRIDEIYSNTLWPWMQHNRPGTRLFFCDPPGRSDPDSLFNHGDDSVAERNFVFMHDQEPIQLDLHKPLFDEVANRNQDLLRIMDSDNLYEISNEPGAVITSELGHNMQQLCSMYGWRGHYYFYHGWAALDWYRGYNRSFLITRARERTPTTTFMSPNRIVGGRRDHRILFLYHVFKNKLAHNHISAPLICPQEHISVHDVATKYLPQYPDIVDTLERADLPRLFKGEQTQEMTSCWLTNFQEAADSMIYAATETVYFGQRLHITEKTFKAIALEMPFVLVAPAGSLAYMRDYGFKTFDTVWDESYDQELDDFARLEKITALLSHIDTMSVSQKQQLWQQCLPIVEYNYNHFYNGDFESILWNELQLMLSELRL